MQINSPLKNKIITITGLTGSGKSFFGVFLSTFYPRVISNLKIYDNGKKINEDIVSMYDIDRIAYSNQKGVCLIDEGGLNINARRGMSQQNLDFIELGVLSRKKNIDIIVISQLERMLDVAIRELCTCSFDMQSYFIRKDYLMFNVEVKNRHGQLVKKMNADLFKMTHKYNWSYSTLESSKIESNNERNKKVELNLAGNYNSDIMAKNAGILNSRLFDVKSPAKIFL